MPTRAWLVAVISPGSQPGRMLEATLAPGAVLAAAQHEGVVALADWSLQQAQAASAVAQAFAIAARADAGTSMLLEAESCSLLAAMAEIGVDGLLLKGSALAYWAYSRPHLRACCDVDLLLASRDAAEQLSARLTTAGYERAETSGELVAYELLCTRPVTKDWRVEVDIHWRLANSPLFSGVFTFDELMADATFLPRLASNARGLGPVHALLHACMRRALNLSIGVDDKLKWVYDMIVLIDVFTSADCQKMERIAIDKKLAGVVLSGLEMAATIFQRNLPKGIATTLRQAAASEPLDARRLSDWHYMQRKSSKALPTRGLRLRWLWQRVFPSFDYLAYLYGNEHQSYAALMFERLRRARRRVRG